MTQKSPVNQIDHVPLHEKVYVEIRRALISGRFAPGQKLTSRALAKALGTSDMPVRSALGRLVAEGGLIQGGNGAIAVPIVTRDKFREVMELRALLEGRATALASGRVDKAGLRKMRDYAHELAKSIERNDIVMYLDFNQKMKFAIYENCGSATLLALIEILWLQAGPFLRHLSNQLSGIMIINFHLDAIAALERGDGKAASAALSRDILEGMRSLLKTARFAEDEPTDEAASDELLALRL